MSSNPRGSPASAWSLRRKLVVQLIGLLAVVCLIVGVVTEFALNTYLVGKLDDDLRAAGGRAAAAFLGGEGDGPPPPPPHFDGDRPNPIDARGQGVGTLSVLMNDDTVLRASRLGDDGSREPLPQQVLPELTTLPVTARPETKDLGELGEYRLTATRIPTGEVLITGLPLAQVHETLVSVGFTLGGVALGGLLLTGLAGAWTVRRTLRPLDRLAETATEVTGLRLDRGEVALPTRVPDTDTDPRTEVGKLGAALNAMLGHVGAALHARQASETRVRQFVADASHELRTPLAAIRGYAELTRRGDADVPPTVAHAMNRVESESVRMTALVEDLLLLARLDAGRPLADEPVDLSRLTADVVSDAHIAGPKHRWLLELPEEPVLVSGDEARLHQVLANLLSNARAHTPEGTVVRTALVVGEHATLTITDNGPGIPPELQHEVFERFARGDTSRSRAAGSTGLGLAIVAAVVAAHGGTVDVTSEPGRTVFTVRLPRAELSEGASTVAP